MTNSMNILIICKALEGSYAGGIQTHVTCLSEELIRQGHQVTLLTASKKTTFQIKGIKIVKLPYVPTQLGMGLSHFLAEFTFNLAAAQWVKKYSKKFDVVHVQGRSGIMINPKNISIPIVTTIHRLMKIEKKWNDKEYANRLDRFLHQKWALHYEHQILKNSHAVIAVSEACKEEILQVNINIENKLQVIPNGVFIPGHINSEKKDTILFVGRLSKVKGISILLHAMKYVNKNIQLEIVGSGPEKSNITSMIKRLNLKGRVQLLGTQSRPIVNQIMSKSQVLVLPSYHESQGIVILEANANGLPVVASDNSGISQMINHKKNGLLFKTGQVNELAKAINHLLDKPKYAHHLGENGRQMMKDKYDWSKVSGSIIELYKAVA